ncbi:putative O-methyltransferase [Corynebacterium uterequi]|uniref:Putative O-methyltransferase n=1 Tax=Corynebacterium uterequi TaxID=1072256 RepID=A0A0G3HC09_9CORY|nr:putative O-methyltransferase [Corynebacterium uterequi]
MAAQVDYIASTAPGDADLDAAREAAEEFAIATPGVFTGQLLTTFAAGGANQSSSGAVLVTPASAVAGLYTLAGLGQRQSITCIDVEAEHHQSAKTAFRRAGYAPSRARFLPSRPVDVMGRLAANSYHLVYLDVAPLDLPAAVKAALPLLTPGGSLLIARSLLDGTIADPTRRDRDTLCVRQVDEDLLERSDVTVSRLPVDGGLTIVTRLPD